MSVKGRVPCPRCGGTNVHRAGRVVLGQRWVCFDCDGRTYLVRDPKDVERVPATRVGALVYDWNDVLGHKVQVIDVKRTELLYLVDRVGRVQPGSGRNRRSVAFPDGAEVDAHLLICVRA